MKTTFALYFGNRGFFPEKLVAEARVQMQQRLAELGYGAILMDAAATPFGAIESAAEGRIYARWLAEQRGRYQGVIVCLPNFGDETGAVAALQDAGVPIFVQAYPDEIGKMGFENRRDAFCGKLSIMDVFTQYGVKFTPCQPHVVHPCDAQFARQIHDFAATCRIVGGMQRMTVGAIGARTTAFKTVRFDELALQKYGITVETLDLSSVIQQVRDLPEGTPALAQKMERYRGYTGWQGVPEEKFRTICKLAVVLDQVIQEYSLDALALRCWIELEQQLGISPCVILSEINDRGIPAACELDIGNAVPMFALTLASRAPATCLDWNNNYGDDPDKCILFHCGPVPQQLMAAKGQVIDHPMFAKSFGAGCGYGCNVGRIAASPMTFASTRTQDGKLVFYLGEGEFTQDQIEKDFFGCAGVAKIAGLQRKLLAIGQSGYRHHVAVTFGHVASAVQEAFGNYLGYERTEL